MTEPELITLKQHAAILDAKLKDAQKALNNLRLVISACKVNMLKRGYKEKR